MPFSLCSPSTCHVASGVVGVQEGGCVGAWVPGMDAWVPVYVDAWVSGCVGAWVRGCVGAREVCHSFVRGRLYMPALKTRKQGCSQCICRSLKQEAGAV